MTLPVVTYEHQFEYAHDPDGERYPRLSCQIAKAAEPEITVDVDAHLDSGAGRSLFSGLIGTALDIDVGSFDFELGFSSTDIHRNLLGRDFFNLAQIGFREHHLTFYVTPAP